MATTHYNRHTNEVITTQYTHEYITTRELWIAIAVTVVVSLGITMPDTFFEAVCVTILASILGGVITLLALLMEGDRVEQEVTRLD